MQAIPYDVTPGFVIKQTFLELESDFEEKVPAVRRRVSDSFIHFPLSTATALYGATAKRFHADSIESLSDSAEESTDAEPTPISSMDKRDSFGSSSSTTMSALRSLASSSSSDEQLSTSSQEVTADFRSDLICRPSDDSDSASNAAEEAVVCISIGSQCHPGGCGRPCKYNAKKKGCKDGEACTFCHLCKWKPPKDKTRNQRRRAAIAAQKAKKYAEAEATAEAAESADATDDEE